MYDFGRSFISIYGNAKTKEITAEANSKLEMFEPSDGVPCVFWGMTPACPQNHLKLTGSDFVHYAFGEWGDENQLCFKSSTTIPEKLENHLVWFYSKVDPNVLLVNEYDSEQGSFVGVRFKVVENGKIRTYGRHRVVNEDVVFEIDEDSMFEQITWEQLWDMQHDLARDAVNELVTDFPRLKNLPEISYWLKS